MFTRVVEMNSKSGKSQELANTINDRAVPILKKQRGFVDEIVLVSSGKADQVLALSFWNEREDAEEYRKEQYQKIHDMVRPLLETDPEIRTFDVHTSTTHKIAASKPVKEPPRPNRGRARVAPPLPQPNHEESPT